MRAWSRHRGPFLQIFCPYRSAILHLSILFKTNYPVTKNYPVRFFVKKTSPCQFKKKNRFCFPNKKYWGEFICLYKSAILWIHFLYWREIGARILNLILWVNLVLKLTMTTTLSRQLKMTQAIGGKMQVIFRRSILVFWTGEWLIFVISW